MVREALTRDAEHPRERLPVVVGYDAQLLPRDREHLRVDVGGVLDGSDAAGEVGQDVLAHLPRKMLEAIGRGHGRHP